MFCEDFVKEFEQQNAPYKWEELEMEIFQMIGEAFCGATCAAPPAGISSSPRSRAMYAIDLMLTWKESQTGGSLFPL